MRNFASLALVAALGLGAAMLSKPADAAVVVGVGVGYHPGPYWRYPHYVHPGYWHGYGYGWGYGYHRGYGYRGHWR
jgi:hypothetical protein